MIFLASDSFGGHRIVMPVVVPLADFELRARLPEGRENGEQTLDGRLLVGARQRMERSELMARVRWENYRHGVS